MTAARQRQRFVAKLRQALGFEGRVVDQDGTHLGRLTGTVPPDDRPASVTLTRRGGAAVALLAVRVSAAPRIRIAPGTLATRLKEVLGLKKKIAVGDKDFDDLLVLEAPNRERATAALARGDDVRSLIVEAFKHRGVERLELGTPNLVATVPLERLRSAEAYASLLDLTAEIARGFDRVGLAVKVLGCERFALAGVHGRPRCAYCHAAVTGDEPDLVACATCRTVLHDGCWQELGRCPVFGCTGAARERAGPGT